jgi:hypothetical protein
MKKLCLGFVVLLLCVSPAFAALPATAQFDVRTGGSDSNGGCFDPSVASPGTDFSQQNSAQVAFTDLVIGSTVTQLTSAANPFTSASVGNCINITAGTGFTTGRYNVLSVASGVATMDRAVGTAASTGGTGNLGGSMASPVTAMAAIVSLNTVWLKAGTYTTTATITNPSSTAFVLNGYSATHGDNLAGAIVTSSTNSISMVTINAGTPTAWINNLAISTTAGSPGDGILVNGSGATTTVSNCSLSGAFNVGIDQNSNGVSLLLLNTLITGTSGDAIQASHAVTVVDSQISGNGRFGIFSINTTSIQIIRSIFANNASRGINFFSAGLLWMFDSTIANNGSDGINTITGASIIQNSIIYGNSGFGVIAAGTTLFASTNAYGSNTSGNRSGFPASATDVVLTTTPFPGSGNYALNSTVGGGAALKGVGYPGVFPGALTTGHLDIGAVQSVGGGGGSSPGNYGSSH